MKRIATLIPTYKRADKLQDFIRQHNENSVDAKLYFVVTPDDMDSQAELVRLGEEFLICDGEYVAAINFGFASTNEEFVLCASDDVLFNKDWDVELLTLADENKDKHIFGGIDEWKISRTLKHISHPLIRREHYTSPIYYPEYIHYMCDIEFVQRGFLEGCVMITPQVLIEHPHTVSEHLVQAEWDDTYKRSFAKIEHDHDLYNRRKPMFEQYNFEDLKEGRVTIAKSNPEYSETFVSIVIPTYNDADFLKGVLQSIAENTYYRYEIIILDNGSSPIQKTNTPWDKIDTAEFLNAIRLGDQSCKLVIKRFPKNQWVNPMWNTGAEMATGKYVAVINADILLSKDWDKYMVAALEGPLPKKFTISCPFETNPHVSVPYALDKWFMKHVPHMLKGPCFMFRKADVPKLFPIPAQIKHWCGDNLLADRANEMDGVVYARNAQIYHFVTQAGNRVKRSKITNRTYRDVLEYEKYTGKNCEWLKATFPEITREYYMHDKTVD